MSQDYSDPRFGVQVILATDISGAINGTVAATELFRYPVKRASTVVDIGVRFKVGGTDAVRQVIVGTAAGAGAMTAIGTATLGTQANNSTKLLGIAGAVAAGESLVFQQLGTGSEPYNISFLAYLTEKFVNV